MFSQGDICKSSAAGDEIHVQARGVTCSIDLLEKCVFPFQDVGNHIKYKFVHHDFVNHQSK